MTSLYEMFLTVLLIANPFGCVPIFVILVKDFDMRTQRKILLRESILGGILALILLHVGRPFLNSILIKQYAVNRSLKATCSCNPPRPVIATGKKGLNPMLLLADAICATSE